MGVPSKPESTSNPPFHKPAGEHSEAFLPVRQESKSLHRTGTGHFIRLKVHLLALCHIFD